MHIDRVLWSPFPLEVRLRESLVEVGLETPGVQLNSNENSEKETRNARQDPTSNRTVAIATTVVQADP